MNRQFLRVPYPSQEPLVALIMILANRGLTQPEPIDLTQLGVVKLYCLLTSKLRCPRVRINRNV